VKRSSSTRGDLIGAGDDGRDAATPAAGNDDENMLPAIEAHIHGEDVAARPSEQARELAEGCCNAMLNSAHKTLGITNCP
jgi:hypothetical protein